jgi:hypothetical protein
MGQNVGVLNKASSAPILLRHDQHPAFHNLQSPIRIPHSTIAIPHSSGFLGGPFKKIDATVAVGETEIALGFANLAGEGISTKRACDS